MDFSIRFLHGIRLLSRKEDKKLNEKALKLVAKVHSEASKTETKLKELLGINHPIVSRFSYIMVILENLDSTIEANVEDGVPIDPDDFSQSG